MRPIDSDLLKAGLEEDGHLTPYIESFIDACPTVEAVTKPEQPEEDTMDKTFTRDELINILRGWNKMFVQLGRGYERNVQALAQAADMLEMDRYRIENQPNYDEEY